MEQLTAFLNQHWAAETVPEEWKHAEIVMIPKPGKKLQVTNLRPISLTSCLGKLYERIVTKRLQHCMEENELYPIVCSVSDPSFRHRMSFSKLNMRFSATYHTTENTF